MTRQMPIGEYPADWPEIARRTKDEAGWCCVRCQHPHDPPNGYTLTVHHLNMDKSDCRWFNIAALCQRCHLSIQGRVIMDRPWLFEHTDWFRPYVAGFYAWKYLHEDLSRDEVMARLPELLALERAVVLGEVA
jgi:hypothetical protein